MRRSLHAVLVALLSLSLTADAAKACWYLRHGHRRHAARVVCAPASAAWPAHACEPMDGGRPHDGWATEVVVAEVCGDEGSVAADCQPCDASALSAGVEVHSFEEVACGPEVDCCGEGTDAIVTSEEATVGVEVTSESILDATQPVEAAVAEPVPAEETVHGLPVEEAASVITPEPTAAAGEPIEPVLIPTPDTVPVTAATPTPVEPTPVEPAAAHEAAAPAAEPLVPDATQEPEATPATTAPTEPAGEPVPQPELPGESVEEPAVEAPAPVEEAEEENLFEEADKAPGEPAEEAVEMPADEPADAAEEPAEEPLTDTESADAEPATEPSEPPTAEPGEGDAVEEPAAGTEEPAAEPGPFDNTRHGRPRRWIDASGAYATVGSLIGLHREAATIRTADGRTVVVPLERLSDHDRAFVNEAGARLASLREPGAASPTDTAGL